MNKKVKASIIIVVFAILTLLDIGLTYYNTPDLAMEANPIVAVWGMGWGALIVANVVTFIILAVLVWYSFCVYKTPEIIAVNEQDLKNKLEKTSGKGSFFAMLGYALSYSMIVSRIIVVLEWVIYTLGYDVNDLYRFLKRISVGRFDLMVAIALTLILAIIWLYREEKRKKELATIRSLEEAFGLTEQWTEKERSFVMGTETEDFYDEIR